MTRSGSGRPAGPRPSAPPLPPIAAAADIGHYAWGEGCDGWQLTRDDALSVVEELMPPGTAETPHLHRRARQFFYVLEGRASMRLAEGDLSLSAGHGLEIGPAVLHQIRNDGEEPVRFLAVSSPATRDDREERDWND